MGLSRNGLRRAGLRLVYGHKATSDSYQAWLRAQGVLVGKRTRFYSPWTIRVDTQRPWMIEIGNDVHITADVSILQHDYSWAVFQHRTGEVLGSCGPVRIGNNVFIGQRALVLQGSDIGDDVIVGAGSVVTGRLEGGAIYAGAPARRIMSIDEFQKKRRARQFIEAQDLVRHYFARYGRPPGKWLLREFFWLFESKTKPLDDVFEAVHASGGNAERSAAAFAQNDARFSSYSDFLDACLVPRNSQ